MKTFRTLAKPFALTLCLCAAALLSGCDQLKAPEFKRVENLRLVGLNQNEIKLSGDAFFFNPNPFGGLALAALKLGVDIEGTHIGDVEQSDLDIDIRANKEFAVPFELSFPISKLGTQSALSGLVSAFSDKKLAVKLDGKVTVGLADLKGVKKSTDFSTEKEVPIQL